MEVRVIETAIEALGDLEQYLSDAARAGLWRSPDDVLTERERVVLALLADGFTTGEIAQRLSLSQHTVRSRVKVILAKLGARNREHAVALAIRGGDL
jgi:DNA-binding NarL/FixJ family response regulator